MDKGRLNYGIDELWNILTEYFNADVFVDFAQVMMASHPDEFCDWAKDHIANELDEQELIEDGWIEDTSLDDLIGKLMKVKGEFYLVGSNKVIDEDDIPYDNLWDAIDDVLMFMSEGKNRLVVDEKGNEMFNCQSIRLRERYAMGDENELSIIEDALTREAESLLANL